jgi:hypothetical protein
MVINSAEIGQEKKFFLQEAEFYGNFACFQQYKAGD